jgi:hypothetical protein
MYISYRALSWADGSSSTLLYYIRKWRRTPGITAVQFWYLIFRIGTFLPLLNETFKKGKSQANKR